jgi:hypothetical protein
MSTQAEPVILELEEVQSRPTGRAVAVADQSPMSMMLAAQQQGASLDQIERMMALQERWEANEARKAYNAAFSAFKAEAVRIIKNRRVDQGPLAGKSYAELHAVVDALTPALSAHGLSASWKLTKDEPTWMEVTCYLRHVNGHEESVSMGGPPDAGGAKNAIQARASTKSYLERYTLKAICGVAEGGEDDDGNGGANASALADMIVAIKEAPDQDALKKLFAECITATKGNNSAQKQIIAAKDARKKELP